jgi:hypothetical protein
MIFIQRSGAACARDALPEMSAAEKSEERGAGDSLKRFYFSYRERQIIDFVPPTVKVSAENDPVIGCRHRLSLHEKSI